MASQNGRADSPSETPMFRFEELPRELQLIAFKSLIPDPIPTGTGTPLSADILRSIKALHSLCFTCRKYNTDVVPMLYRYIIITDYTQMASLLVTLIFHPNRRNWMRYLAVLVEFPPGAYDMEKVDRNFDFMEITIKKLGTYDTLNREANLLEDFNAVRAVLPRLKEDISVAPVNYEHRLDPDSDSDSDSDDDYSLGSFNWDGYERGLNEVYEALLQLLLRFQPNIEDILLTAPNSLAQRLCPPQLQVRIMNQFRINPTQPASEDPFKTLRSIRKQTDPGSSIYFHPDPLQPGYLSTKGWEFFRDNGTWFFNDYLNGQGWPLPVEAPRDLTVFSHITELVLYESLTHPAQLRVILSSCKALESLSYTAKVTDWPDKYVSLAATGDDEEVPVPTMQQALDEVRETLTGLRLGWVPWEATLSEVEQAAVAPHRVDVSSFPRLNSSEIDPAFVRKVNSALK